MTFEKLFNSTARTGVYSNNFWLYLRYQLKKNFYLREKEVKVFKEHDSGLIRIGYDDEGLFLIGVNFIEACCNGGRTKTYAIPYKKSWIEITNFAELYSKYGRNVLIAFGHDFWQDGFKGDENLGEAKEYLSHYL